LCSKAIATSDSIWENCPLFYYIRYILYIPSQFSHVWIHNQRRNPSKHTQQGNDSGSAANGSAVGGSSAAPSDAADNTNQAGNTYPLKAALVLKVNFIELLPIASRPFLTPLAKSTLREFACHFYAEE
jgi:hypothetical protein